MLSYWPFSSARVTIRAASESDPHLLDLQFLLNHGFVHYCMGHLNHYAMSTNQMRRKGELPLN